MKRLLGGIVAIVAVLLAVMVVRTMRIAPPATAQATNDTTTLVFDTTGAAQRLAGAVKFPTVSLTSGGPIDTAAFLGLHQYLQTSFPRVTIFLLDSIAGPTSRAARRYDRGLSKPL